MAGLSVEDVVRGTQGALVAGDLGVPVTGVSIDSRHLAIGCAFFAIQGPNRDGHAFLRDAAARGASCLVVHNLPDDLPPSVPTILVDDTTRALGRLGAYHRARFTVPVAAVTGSNGKTTTKEMMASVLEALGPVLKPEGSFNNQWGLPLTLLRLGPEHRALALELGANTPGEIESLAAICRPTVGVVTVVQGAHTEAFGSLDGVATEKSALVRAIPPDGTVVLNADDPRVLAMRDQSRARVLYYGTRPGTDVSRGGPGRRSGRRAPLHARDRHRAAPGAPPLRGPAQRHQRARRRRRRPGPRALARADRAGPGGGAAGQGALRVAPRGPSAHPGRHLQRQSRLGGRRARDPGRAVGRAPARGGAGRHARAGGDQRGRPPRHGAGGGRLRRGGVPRDGPLGAGGGGGRAPGRARREPSRDHVRGCGGAAAQAAGARRRGARQGLPGHAHGARGGRARGALRRRTMPDALRAAGAARQVPHRLQRVPVHHVPDRDGDGHRAGDLVHPGPLADHPAARDAARRIVGPGGHAGAAPEDQGGDAHHGGHRDPGGDPRVHAALGEPAQPLRVGAGAGHRRARADRPQGRLEEAQDPQGHLGAREVRGPDPAGRRC